MWTGWYRSSEGCCRFEARNVLPTHSLPPLTWHSAKAESMLVAMMRRYSSWLYSTVGLRTLVPTLFTAMRARGCVEDFLQRGARTAR